MAATPSCPKPTPYIQLRLAAAVYQAVPEAMVPHGYRAYQTGENAHHGLRWVRRKRRQAKQG
jgi:hypothetical protein